MSGPRKIVTTRVTIDGKPVDPNQLPADLRGWMEDKDGNGLPDALDAMMARDGASAIQVSQKITINGQSYASLDEVPEPLRERVRQLMGNLSAGRASQATVQPTPSASPLESAWAAGLVQPTRERTDRRRGNTALILLAAIGGAVLTYLLMR